MHKVQEKKVRLRFSPQKLECREIRVVCGIWKKFNIMTVMNAGCERKVKYSQK